MPWGRRHGTVQQLCAECARARSQRGESTSKHREPTCTHMCRSCPILLDDTGHGADNASAIIQIIMSISHCTRTYESLYIPPCIHRPPHVSSWMHHYVHTFTIRPMHPAQVHEDLSLNLRSMHIPMRCHHTAREPKSSSRGSELELNIP